MENFKFEDIFVGMTQQFDVTVNTDMLDKFLQISGDFNPLHVDEGYAKSKGFKSKVVYGLLTSSFYSTLVGVHLPGKYCILHGLNISFTKPVYVGDRLTIMGEVSHTSEAYKQLEIKATITNQDGSKVSKAKIKCGVIDV